MLQLEKTLLKDVVEALSDLFVEANFGFSGTGLELQAMDPIRFALVVLFLPKNAFTKYHCDKDLSVCLNLAKMRKAFRCANNDDIVTMSVEDDSNMVTLAFESPKYGRTNVKLESVSLDSVLYEIEEYPESQYQAIVRISSANFMRICKKLSSFNDDADSNPVVSIWVDKKGVRFSTWAGTSIIVCREIHPTVDKMEKDVSVMFDLRYMNSFSKLSTLSHEVTMRISSKLPTVFEYKIAEEGYIRYYMMAMQEEERQNEGDEMQTDD